ncbi:hypothetical protein CBM2633_P330002 [Cupriavidus taiwanensis]|uniref:Uncharacterized protein n=2 Tax=Cupriavidus TaxID=106589 RepID=A0A375DBV6_9BURK|nr:hypothetical protein CBM2588_P360002 [Cupriavidus taiwanensis]SOZ40631.1 hypothetical protein CBM2605_P330002 [Cupriavidus neocaledonicus]SOY75903.1 hypothetical protein CBM2585_P330002 [Cupriavidus taiwanensis]SOY75912.1 hypothetical protein CBM2592_P360002 [Cupriavidus taiwanensis]SOY76714.1 hypothetical protein CBM2589_P330002 [Cupriavidus taiwanensis]
MRRRTPCAGVLSDGVNRNRSVRHQDAMTVRRRCFNRGVELVGAAARPARQPRHCGYGINQGFEDHRVVPIGTGHGQRRAGLRRGGVWCRACHGRWGSGRSAAPLEASHSRTIDTRPAPIDLVMLTQSRQQGQLQAFPDAAGLPITKATPASHTAAEAQFLRQVFPRNPLRKGLLAMLVSGQVENLWLDRVGRAGHVWRVVANRCAAQRANHHGTRLPQPCRNGTIS